MDNAPQYLHKNVHDEYAKRMDAENTRQNRRIEGLEDQIKQINDLTMSVHKLATSVETLTKELTGQGTRLSALEGRDGEKWREISKYVVTALIGLAIGFLAEFLIGA